jgi:hypothetical protein
MVYRHRLHYQALRRQGAPVHRWNNDQSSGRRPCHGYDNRFGPGTRGSYPFSYRRTGRTVRPIPKAEPDTSGSSHGSSSRLVGYSMSERMTSPLASRRGLQRLLTPTCGSAARMVD